MFNLKQSVFVDMEIETENNYNLSDDLYSIIFSFLSVKELPKISLCSKKFNEIIEKLDYKYKFLFDEKFCSSYKNYE
jgi:hypothetical protein